MNCDPVDDHYFDSYSLVRSISGYFKRLENSYNDEKIEEFRKTGNKTVFMEQNPNFFEYVLFRKNEDLVKDIISENTLDFLIATNQNILHSLAARGDIELFKLFHDKYIYGPDKPGGNESDDESEDFILQARFEIESVNHPVENSPYKGEQFCRCIFTHVACYFGQIDIVKYLEPFENKITCLKFSTAMCCKNNEKEILKFFISLNKDPNHYNEAFKFCYVFNQPESMEILLENGLLTSQDSLEFSLKFFSKIKETSKRYEEKMRCFRIFSPLIKKISDKNKAIMILGGCRNSEVFDFLVNLCDPNLQNSWGASAISYAILDLNIFVVEKYFNIFDKSIKDNKGLTLLHHAIRSNDERIFDIVSNSKDIDYEIKTRKGENYLQYALNLDNLNPKMIHIIKHKLGTII